MERFVLMKLREHPELLAQAARWFHQKWGIPQDAYRQSMAGVETAALAVFDALKKYHGMKERERLLLQIAADLHSCGKFVTLRDATDCAYNIIMATEIIGLSHVEREIVANVVKF